MPDERADSAAQAARQAQRRHRDSMRVVAEVEACLDRQPTPPADWVATLMGKLETLSRSLHEHFAEQGGGPLYRQLPLAFPRFAAPLDRLLVEHGEMLSMLDELVATGRRLEDPQLYELREFDARVQLLVARIRRHEAQENEILVEALWDEIGGGD